MFGSKPARHAVGYRYRVGRYLRKPRMIPALSIVLRLVSERGDSMPTRQTITRHRRGVFA